MWMRRIRYIFLLIIEKAILFSLIAYVGFTTYNYIAKMNTNGYEVTYETASPHIHSLLPATCHEPAHCIDCGFRMGSNRNHLYVNTDCSIEKVCELCGDIIPPSTHSWKIWADAVECTYCKKKINVN